MVIHHLRNIIQRLVGETAISAILRNCLPDTGNAILLRRILWVAGLQVITYDWIGH